MRKHVMFTDPHDTVNATQSGTCQLYQASPVRGNGLSR